MNNSNPTLRKAYKILKKVTKKLGNPDLYFSVGLSVNSTKDKDAQTFTAYIAPPREGLAPVTLAAPTKEDFIQKLNDFYNEKISPDQVEVAFHESQILENDRSNKYHREQIDKILNPPKEEEVSQEDVEVAEVQAEEAKKESAEEN